MNGHRWKHGANGICIKQEDETNTLSDEIDFVSGRIEEQTGQSATVCSALCRMCGVWSSSLTRCTRCDSDFTEAQLKRFRCQSLPDGERLCTKCARVVRLTAPQGNPCQRDGKNDSVRSYVCKTCRETTVYAPPDTTNSSRELRASFELTNSSSAKTVISRIEDRAALNRSSGVQKRRNREAAAAVFDLQVNVDNVVKVGDSESTDKGDVGAASKQGNVSSSTDKKKANKRQVKKPTNLPVKRSQKCPICEKVLSSLPNLQRHKKLHTETKQYKCQFCERRFMYQSQARDHERIHTGGKPNACRFCGKRFLLMKQVVTHERTHTLEKPFSCDICEQSFSASSSLVAHKRIHSGEKPYRCKLCGNRFRVQSKLTRHMKSHTDDKPHKCRFCDKRFIRLYRAKEHEASKHYIPSLERLRCGLCNKGFSSVRGVMLHKRAVHDSGNMRNRRSTDSNELVKRE